MSEPMPTGPIEHTLGEGAKSYSDLETATQAEVTQGFQPAGEFYRDLVHEVVPALGLETSAPLQRLLDNVEDHAALSRKIIWPEIPGEPLARPFDTERDARSTIKFAIEDAARYLARDTAQGQDGTPVDCPTLLDASLKSDFDYALTEELQAVLGAGREVDERVREQGGRYERSYFETNIPGYKLVKWRHHQSGRMTETMDDSQKFFLERA